MTTMMIRKTSLGEYKSFTCMGHANYAKFFQKDIVCAAISALVINTINSIEEIGKDPVEVRTNEDTGFIDCRFNTKISQASIVLMRSLELGLQAIEQQYGNKYFELKFEEV